MKKRNNSQLIDRGTMAKYCFWISLLLIIATFTLMKIMNIGEDVEVVSTNLDNIPSTIAGSHSTEITLEESARQALDPDVYVYRNYRTTEGRILNLYIGYYGTRKGGRTGHNPHGCYPGSGWVILHEGKAIVTVEQNGEPKDIVVNVITVKKGETKQLVYHWYQSAGNMVISSGFQQNIHRFITRLLYNRNDGAFVRVTLDISDNNYSVAKDVIELFIRNLFPLLVEFWPEERESGL
ncbi:MAG: EpsI family protein [Desulfomonilia bacterium]|nr:EpsI family protein [Desulfomonilia bacterium]